MSVTAPPILTYFGAPEGAIPTVIDERIHYFSPLEQDRLNMRQFQELDELTFLTKLATREGRLHAPLRKMSIASIDAGLYLDSFPTRDLRQALSLRYGIAKETLLAEIDNRLKLEVIQKKVKATNKPASMKESSPKPHDKPKPNPLPVATHTVEPVLPEPKSEPPPKRRDNEQVWQ
jgi:hypothetical protein